MPSYLAVRNLAKHQHYKDRRPPWIKLHRTVLSDYAFNRLQDASKAHLMLIWLLATEYDNRIPNDPEWIARKIDATTPVDVEALVSAGFLDVYDDASGALAGRAESIGPEREEEAEGETEHTHSARVAPEVLAPLVEKLGGGDSARTALTDFVDRIPPEQPVEKWLSIIDTGFLGGTHMPGKRAAKPEHVLTALVEFVLASYPYSSGNVRSFIERVQRGEIGSAKDELSARRAAKSTGEKAPSSDAAEVLAQIRGLAKENYTAAAGTTRFIPKDAVRALGDDVFRAYDAIGGAARILGTKPEHLGLLQRDFAEALSHARRSA